ncbi:MAG TPA: protein-glutamate O-methyltransferase CheR [Tissierellia bacterium]|nr:protein-glutamate O-methyltransferase CheR [Tissierellia bacterium]
MEQFEIFKKRINNLINIDLNLYKENQMLRRITSLMKRNGFDSFEEYYAHLETDRSLLDQFIDYLTINVSEFFRNPSQWEVLQKDILPSIITKLNRPLNIWSSACSTGEEPYSLAMLLTKFYRLEEINILATDIDTVAIEKAKKGIYDEKAISKVPIEFLDRFFENYHKSYKIKDEIKNTVRFERIDLLKDPFPKHMDLILCRNVIIYFTSEAKDMIYTKFYNSLNDNGILFVGSTEQILTPEKYSFKPVKTFFYTKYER